jgi:serine/threonine-protein kinase HipA
MGRAGNVYISNTFAGIISEAETGYRFIYDKDYLQSEKAIPISLTLPLQEEPFESKTLFAFFDGLIPEGWLLDISIKNWKLNSRDRMGLLLAVCKDCVGAVSITPIEDKEVSHE